MESPKSSEFRFVWHRSLDQISEKEGVAKNIDPGGYVNGDARRTSLVKKES